MYIRVIRDNDLSQEWVKYSLPYNVYSNKVEIEFVREFSDASEIPYYTTAVDIKNFLENTIPGIVCVICNSDLESFD